MTTPQNDTAVSAVAGADDRLAAIESDLSSVTTAIAQAKISLATGGVPELRDLPQVLDRARDAMRQLPAGTGKKFEVRLMALLDDAAGLERSLRQSLATLDNLRQTRDTHQQAAAAYRTPRER